MKFGKISAATPARNIARQAMPCRNVGTLGLEDKYVAAQSHYQTKLRDVRPSLDNDRNAPR